MCSGSKRPSIGMSGTTVETPIVLKVMGGREEGKTVFETV